MRFGVIGNRHPHIFSLIREAQAHPGVELVAVAEDHPPSLQKLREAVPGNAYADYREMLEQERLEAVLLAPVNSKKAAAVVDLLERGIHALADKPLLTTAEDLARVEAAHRRSGAALYLALTMRFDPYYIAARRAVAGGAIGKIVNCFVQGPHKLRPQTRDPWMLNDEENGGVTIDLGCHDVDLIRWFTGAELAEITAYESNMKFPQLKGFTDNCATIMRMTDGSTALIRIDWMTPGAASYHMDFRLMMTGAEGMMEVRHGPENLVQYASDASDTAVVGPVDPPHGLIQDFLYACAGRSDTLLTARDAIEATRITLLARQSAREGRTVSVS